MELVCEKYKEKMLAEGACCRHPDEYCKFRSACIIHFISKESARCDRHVKTEKDEDEVKRGKKVSE